MTQFLPITMDGGYIPKLQNARADPDPVISIHTKRRISMAVWHSGSGAAEFVDIDGLVGKLLLFKEPKHDAAFASCDQ